MNKLKCIVMIAVSIENLTKLIYIYIYIYIYILKKTASLSIAYIKCGRKYENIFTEEESIEMLKIPNLINNIDEYQKIYNHV